MAKNREQLIEEATELGIDFSSFETNRQFQDAINEVTEVPNKEDVEPSSDSTEAPQEELKDEVDEEVKPETPKKRKGGTGEYKGYNINWLRDLGEEHPDFYLVAEYDKKYSK